MPMMCVRVWCDELELMKHHIPWKASRYSTRQRAHTNSNAILDVMLVLELSNFRVVALVLLFVQVQSFE